MKRKFFSLMVAACAALFSFTGLTGCGGGGDGQSTPGYLSYSDFTSLRKGIMLRGSQVWLKILPTSRLTTDGDKKGEGINSTSSGVAVFCTLMNDSGDDCYNVAVDYNILTWVDREKGIPATAEMKFSMAESGDVLNKELLAALGWTSSADEDFTLSADLNMTLIFTGNGGEVWYSITLNENPISYRGYFSVIPNEI